LVGKRDRIVGKIWLASGLRIHCSKIAPVPWDLHTASLPGLVVNLSGPEKSGHKIPWRRHSTTANGTSISSRNYPAHHEPNSALHGYAWGRPHVLRTDLPPSFTSHRTSVAALLISTATCHAAKSLALRPSAIVLELWLRQWCYIAPVCHGSSSARDAITW
jgi:hypothetical protein